MKEIERIDRCASELKSRFGNLPDQAIILGSGLGDFADRLADAQALPYAEIEGFPRPTVEGHRGELIRGTLSGKPVLVMAGRFHYYEGHPLSTVVFPARVLARAGVKKLFITNAAGGVNTGFSPGDLMLISDHLNIAGTNPLMGDNLDELGPRFPDMSEVYDRDLRELAKDIAKRLGIELKEGVYAWGTGPSYETPAEVRMARALGADAVGMSTVPEAIAANHAGLKILGISLITNMAAGILDQPLHHREVVETAAKAARRFGALVEGILAEMP